VGAVVPAVDERSDGASEVAHGAVGAAVDGLSFGQAEPLWVLAVATLAEHLPGECPFPYGDTLNFGEPIAHGTEMDGFVVLGIGDLDARAFAPLSTRS
jgi:hypothetical protein